MGYLSREAGRPRTMVVRLPGPDGDGIGAPTPGDDRVADVPLMGRIAAGSPVIADGRPEDIISVPRMLTGEGSLVALRVCGDSMIGAAIADGDWVVVREQPDADSGDIVAAMLANDATGDYEATVKTLRKSGGHAWLLPRNVAYAPIPADGAVIIGKVVSVLRRLLARHGPGGAERHQFRDISGDLLKDAPRSFRLMLCLEGDHARRDPAGFPCELAWGSSTAFRGSLGGEIADSSGRCRRTEPEAGPCDGPLHRRWRG
jgi:repressor LexA